MKNGLNCIIRQFRDETKDWPPCCKKILLPNMMWMVFTWMIIYPDPTSAGQMVSDAGDFQTYGAGYNIEDFRKLMSIKQLEFMTL